MKKVLLAGAGTDLEKYVAVVQGICGQQQFIQFHLQGFFALGRLGDFLLGHFPYGGIGILQHVARGGDVIERSLIAFETGNHRAELSVLNGQFPELRLVGNDVRIRQERIELLQPFGEGLQFAA